MITKYTAKLHYSFFQLLVSTTSLTRDDTFIHIYIITNLLAWYSRIYRPPFQGVEPRYVLISKALRTPNFY
jgi:hypothetical protein